MPKQMTMGYWLGYIADGNKLAEVPANIDVVSLAFALTGDNDSLNADFLTSKHAKQDIRDGIQVLQKRGQKVTVSINGDASKRQYGWLGLDPVEFANHVGQFVNDWGLDGVDFDNQDRMFTPELNANGMFIRLVQETRNRLGAKAIVTAPVYLGQPRDLYLNFIMNELTCVYTMAYWADVPQQKKLIREYEALVGAGNVGVGVAMKGAANDLQETSFEIVKELASIPNKAGMMLWHLNSRHAQKWCDEIEQNLGTRT